MPGKKKQSAAMKKVEEARKKAAEKLKRAKILKGKDFEAHLKRRNLTGLELRPKLVTLSEQVGEGNTTVLGKVSIMVVTLIKRRMEFNSGGEANSWIESTDISDGERTDMENTVLDASADAAVMQVLEYLASRSDY